MATTNKLAQRLPRAPCQTRRPRSFLQSTRQARLVATNAAASFRGPQEFIPDSPPSTTSTPSSTRRDALHQAKPFSEFLTDSFNRQHDYLRISLTERCNLRCTYCMPEEGVQLSPNRDILTTPEIYYLSALFVNQGVNKIRLTGGEPTVRKDIVSLMQQIGSLRRNGLKELALTTNGISLHRKLDDMVEAGLTGVNISLDTLDPFQFPLLTRRNGFNAVMKSINRVQEMNKLGAGVKLKINCVAMRGVNDNQIIPFVEMTRDQDVEVRFIEYMPFGGNKWSERKMLPYAELVDLIRAQYPTLERLKDAKNDTSKTWQVPGFAGRVGFITSMTHNFCGTCNRLRITSDGNLKVCLHGNSEVSLRDLLRQERNGEPMDEEAFEAIRQLELDRRKQQPEGLAFDGEAGWMSKERQLLEVIGAAVQRKKAGHAGMGELENMKNRPMILIGEASHSHGSNTRPIPNSSPRYWRSFGASSLPTHLFTPSFANPASSQARVYSTERKIKAGGDSGSDMRNSTSHASGIASTHGFQSLSDLFKQPTRGRYSRPSAADHEHDAEQPIDNIAPQADQMGMGETIPVPSKSGSIESSTRSTAIPRAETIESRSSSVDAAAHGSAESRPESESAESIPTLKSAETTEHKTYRPQSLSDQSPTALLTPKAEISAAVRSAFRRQFREPSMNDSSSSADLDPRPRPKTRTGRVLQLRTPRVPIRKTGLRPNPFGANSNHGESGAEEVPVGATGLRPNPFAANSNHREPGAEEVPVGETGLRPNPFAANSNHREPGAEEVPIRKTGLRPKANSNHRELPRQQQSTPEHVSPADKMRPWGLIAEKPVPATSEGSPDADAPTIAAAARSESSQQTTLKLATSPESKGRKKAPRKKTVKPSEPRVSQATPSPSPSYQEPAHVTGLTHVSSTGEAHMVDVGSKQATRRVAIATCLVRFSNKEPCRLILENNNKKGDVLGVARIAGIMAAKRTSELIPLCHPIAISRVEVQAVLTAAGQLSRGLDLKVGKESKYGNVLVEARVECHGQTGVEMEALTAATTAGLTVIDMCKAVDKRINLGKTAVRYKSGGRSGLHCHEAFDHRGRQWFLDNDLEIPPTAIAEQPIAVAEQPIAVAEQDLRSSIRSRAGAGEGVAESVSGADPTGL